MSDNPPNQTLYIKNINEKIKREELKKSLQALFSSHGPILEVIAMKTVKMRGQAFIVFKDLSSATQALITLQGFMFYDKPMTIQYAKGKSFAVGKLDGTLEDLKRKRDDEKEKETREPKRTVEKARPPKESLPAAAKLLPEEAALPPNKILFIQNLPEDVPEDVVKGLFVQFPGFIEVRVVPSKPDLAFVEFDSEMNSAVAKENLHKYRLGQNVLKITFAKR